MADLADWQHYDAFMSLLRADGQLTSYPDNTGFTPKVAGPEYVRVYMSIDRQAGADGNSLAGRSSTWTARYFCHCVGENEYGAVAIAMRVRALVLDVRPTITGRSVGLIREEQAPPPGKDDATGDAVFDALCVYRLTTCS
jgi:hypothetical protein